MQALDARAIDNQCQGDVYNEAGAGASTPSVPRQYPVSEYPVSTPVSTL